MTEQTEREPLKPCPFCGKSESVQVCRTSDFEDEEYFDNTGNPNEYTVICAAAQNGKPWIGCGGQGGFKPTEAGAIAIWQARAQQPIDQHTVTLVRGPISDAHLLHDELETAKGKIVGLKAKIAFLESSQQLITRKPTKQVLWKCGYCGKHDLSIQAHMGRCMGSVSGSTDTSLIPQNSPAQQPEAVPVVPEGWKLVPIEPTKEMYEASINSPSPWKILSAWKCMLAAAPPAPTQSGGNGS